MLIIMISDLYLWYLVAKRIKLVRDGETAWCQINDILIPGGGGGGALILFPYVGLGPASTVLPKKYQEFQTPPPPQKNENLAILKYPPFFIFTLRTVPKMHRMTSKYIHKIFIPPKNNRFFFFLKTPKKYWNSKFWTQKKMTRVYVCMKNQSTPSPLECEWVIGLPEVEMSTINM